MKNYTVTGGSFLVPFFKLLNDYSVRYCVLRNYESLPQSADGSDVDMWVHEDDLSSCLKALITSAEDSGMSLVTTYGDSAALKVGLQSDNDGIQIDLFKGNVYFKNMVLSDADTILRYTKKYNGLSVMDDDYADLLALLKELLNNGRVKAKYLNPIYEKSVYLSAYLKNSLPNFNQEFIDEFANSVEKKSIEKDAKRLQALAIKNISSKSSLSSLSLGFDKIKRVLGKRTGYVIVVEGTDGSGKSFIIDSISPILNGAFHNSITYNHLRPNWLPDIAEILGKRKKPKKGEEVTVVSDPHAGKQSGFIGSVIRWGWYMIDYTIGYLVKVCPQIHSKSKVFIFDRYYYEFYLDQKRSHVKLPMWVVKFGEWLLPKPDLILCLGGDPEKIYARKPETSLEEVIRQTKVLQDFCKQRKNAVWVDTTLKPEDSIEAAMVAINNVMSKRFDINKIR